MTTVRGKDVLAWVAEWWTVGAADGGRVEVGRRLKIPMVGVAVEGRLWMG